MTEQSSQLRQASEKIHFASVALQEMSKQLQQLAELQEEPKEKTYGIEWFRDELFSYFRNNFLPSLGDVEDFIEYEGTEEYGGYKVRAMIDENAIERTMSNQFSEFIDEFIDHLSYMEGGATDED